MGMCDPQAGSVQVLVQQCVQVDLPNRAESQNQRGKCMLVRSIGGVRQTT